MKKILLISIAMLMSGFLAVAQRQTYTSARETSISNYQFTSNLTGWNNTSGWSSNSNTAYSTSTSNVALTHALTNLSPTLGYLHLKFDVKLRRSGGSSSLNVSLGSARYLVITRESNDQVTVVPENNATYTVSGSAWSNSNNENNLTTIELKIPRATAFTGTLSLAYASNNSNNFIRLDNVSFFNTAVATQWPTVATCPTCLPITSSNTNDEVSYNDARPLPECKTSATGGNIYKYYLPAMASMPAALSATNASAPTGFTITTELPSVIVTVYRPDGTLVSNHLVTNTAATTIATTLNDVLTSTYGSVYSGSNKGYIIESDQPITVRWALDHVNNRASVILRGEQAVGKAFRTVSAMRANVSSATSSAEGDHYLTVMSLENNTKVQIGRNADAINTNEFTIVTLNKGQQYTVAHNTQTVTGYLVLADKPVVVSSGQQHKRITHFDNNTPASTSLEGTIIQVPPIYALGKEYVVVTTERSFGYQVIANFNNTAVYFNGALVATLQAGESFMSYRDGDDLYGKPFAISLSQPGYVYNIGSNSIGEFELFPAPPVDLPVGKANKIFYSSINGNDGWVIVDAVDVNKLKRNNSATLGATHSWTVYGNGTPNKRVFYWNDNFTTGAQNVMSCDDCNVMYVGQMFDGSSAGAQVGYITSFDVSPLQFFNTNELPNQLLTNGYIIDTINYFTPHATTLNHTVTIGASMGSVEIDTVILSRIGGGNDAGSYVSSNNLTFTLNIPDITSVPRGANDTINVTVYLKDGNYNEAALCLSYIVMNFNPLPVTLLDFGARKQDETSLLTWVTGKERDNKGFFVERSLDGRNWSSLGWVDAQSLNGNSDVKYDYSFVDKQPHNGNNYYRLAQQDFNGQIEWSTVRVVSFSGLENKAVIYPNPTTGIFTVEGLVAGDKVNVHAVSGQLLIQTTSKGEKLNVDISNMASGVYLVTIHKIDGTIQYERIVKNN